MFTHGGNIWALRRKYPNRRLIDFSANINPLGLPRGMKNLLGRDLDLVLHYPDTEAVDLKRTLADYWQISPENIVLGSGSIELIYLIPSLLRFSRVLIPLPNFSEYEKVMKLAKKICLFPFFPRFQFELKKILSYLPRVDLVFLSNPNNPTGYLISNEELNSFLTQAEKNEVVVIMDECFLDFVPGEESLTLIKRAVRKKNILILRTLTKFFALPGLRVGYLVGPKGIISQAEKFLPPWRVNCFAQLLGKAVLENQAFIQQTKEFILREKEYLYQNLQKIKGITPLPPAANYIFCALTQSPIKAHELERCLLEAGIIIRNCANYRGLDGQYFRVAVKRRKENRKLIISLKEILGKAEATSKDSVTPRK